MFNAYTLKMIAIIGMLMQHTVLVLGTMIPVGLHFPLQFGGGFTFPIMAFFLVEGYRHTRNVKKYATRIFVFALVSQVPHMMSLGNAVGNIFNGDAVFFYGNIMFTLFVGLVVLWLYDHMKKRALFWILFVLLSLATLLCDWGIIGPIMILLYHIIKDEKLKRTVVPFLAFWFNLLAGFFIGIGVGFMIALEGLDALEYAVDAPVETNFLAGIAAIMFMVGMLASIPFIRRYSGERGPSMKYMFYAFYPLHLLVLGVLAYLLGINSNLFPWQ